MSNPWMKFYPRDWRGDQALRAVSIAARGLWIECIFIMHEAKPYGHLLLNGNKIDDSTLSRMAGTSVDEVTSLMDELQKAGVACLTSKGVIFSRRMTKDHARAQKGQKSANLRWSQDVANRGEPVGPNRSVNSIPTTQKPESRVQKDKKEKNNKKESPKSELEKVLDPERARAVVDHRQRIRKPLTAHSAKLLANRIAKCHNPNDAADMMLERGWTSVDQSWLDSIKTNGSGKQTIADAIEEVRRELIDEENKAERFGGCGAEPIVALPKPKAR